MSDFLILLLSGHLGMDAAGESRSCKPRAVKVPCLAYLIVANCCFRLECGGDPPETELLPTVPSHLVAGEHDGMGYGAWHRAAQLKQSMS